jgi:hypothetical protein
MRSRQRSHDPAASVGTPATQGDPFQLAGVVMPLTASSMNLLVACQHAQFEFFRRGAANFGEALEKMRTAKSWLDVLAIEADMISTANLAAWQWGTDVAHAFGSREGESLEPDPGPRIAPPRIVFERAAE